MSLKPQLEAIIYAAEIPISLDQIISLVKQSVVADTPDIDAAEIKSRVRAAMEELAADYPARIMASKFARSPADTGCPLSPNSMT